MATLPDPSQLPHLRDPEVIAAIAQELGLGPVLSGTVVHVKAGFERVFKYGASIDGQLIIDGHVILEPPRVGLVVLPAVDADYDVEVGGDVFLTVEPSATRTVRLKARGSKGDRITIKKHGSALVTVNGRGALIDGLPTLALVGIDSRVQLVRVNSFRWEVEN